MFIKMKNTITAILKKLWDNEILMSFIATIVIVILIYILNIRYFQKYDLLSILSGVLQILTVFISFFAWYNTRKLLKEREKNRVTASEGDCILIVSLAQEIKNDVIDFINSDDPCGMELRKLDESFSNETSPQSILENDYMELSQFGSIVFEIRKKKDMPHGEEQKQYISEFRECMGLFSDRKPTKVHIFLSCPSEIPAFMMPFFVNKTEAVLYRYRKGLSQKYERMGTAEKRD